MSELLSSLSVEVVTAIVAGIVAPFAAALGQTVYNKIKKSDAGAMSKDKRNDENL